jgi:pantetheine-phosphate adenylyltransferase
MTEVSTSLRVIYPGSFDPIHNGHIDVIEQTKDLFGSVVVAIMHNPDKPSGLFTVAERVELARSAVADLAGVTVDSYTGLAVHAAERAAANFIVKGLRTAGDFEIEQQMAHMNHSVAGMRTVYVPARPDLGFVSSRFVREIANYGGDVSHLVPPAVADALVRRVAEREQN